MPYTLDMSRHVKIWFSTDPEVFMPPLHQVRLQDIRRRYPNITLTLIYSALCLSPEALGALQQFCKKYTIIPCALETDPVFQNLCAREGFVLYEAALKELAALRLGRGGNAAAASDLVRWIIPVLELGVYSDLDVNITVKNAQVKVCSDRPLLFRVSQNNDSISNDMIIFLGGHKDRQDVWKIHEAIQRAYQFPAQYLKDKKTLIEKTDYFFSDALRLFWALAPDENDFHNKTVPWIRNWIENNIVSNAERYMSQHEFMQKIVKSDSPPKDLQQYFMEQKKACLNSDLSILKINEKSKVLIKWFLQIPSAPEFIEQYFTYVQQQTFLGLVKSFSGGTQLMCLVNDTEEFARYSFRRQGLEKCFSPFATGTDLAWLTGVAGSKRWENRQVDELKKMRAVRTLQKWARLHLFSPRDTVLRSGLVSAQPSVASGLSADAETVGERLDELVRLLLGKVSPIGNP